MLSSFKINELIVVVLIINELIVVVLIVGKDIGEGVQKLMKGRKIGVGGSESKRGKGNDDPP